MIMKVNGENPPIPLTAYRNQILAAQSQTKPESTNSKTGVAVDKVQLSAQAREVQEATNALSKMPDVREEKVQQVKLEVEKGTYRVVGHKVAMDMLKETFENNMLLSQIDTHA
jgi:negative regulator of flagellin synthesis FlgM